METLAESFNTVARSKPVSVPKGFDAPGTVDYTAGTSTLVTSEAVTSEDYRKLVEEHTGLPVPEGLDVILDKASLQSNAEGHKARWLKFKFVPKTLSAESFSSSIAALQEEIASVDAFEKKPHHNKAVVINIADLQLGKALADETPVLTPSGWVKHGDIRAGDYVYAPSGKPVRVLAVTGSSMLESYRVVFDKGAEIVASKDHLWEGYRKYRTGDRKASGANGLEQNEYKGTLSSRELTWTTQQIAEIPRASNGHGGLATVRSFRIPTTAPLEMPERDDLLIEPHLLGVWLGDGNASGATITKGQVDKDWLLEIGNGFPSGDTPNHFQVNVPTLRGLLTAEGLLNNKHIPEKYLYASYSQRLALLQGLMDTDGSANVSGNLEFSNTNLSISAGVEFLLASFGIKYKRLEGIGKLNGVAKKPFVRLNFSSSIPMFTLPRKLDRQRLVLAEQTTTHNVQYAEPVGEVSAQCLTVEGSMYLAGYEMIPTHNCDRNGGTPETVAGFYAAIAQAVEYVKRVKPSVVVMSELGDGIEGFGNVKAQHQTNDLTLVEQIALHTKLITYAAVELSKLTPRLIVVGVPSNHAEIRENGKAVAGVDNDLGLLSLSNVKAAMSLNKEAFGHVEFAWPAPYEVSLTIDVAGVPIGFMHGHNGKGNALGAAKWLEGQFAGNQPLQPAHIINSAHFHHLFIQNITGGRWHFQSPAMDRGSSWLGHINGHGGSQNGLVAYTVQNGSWCDFQLLRSE